MTDTGGKNEATGAVVEAIVVPVVEEVVHVGVRSVDRGGAAIHIAVSTHEERVERELLQDAVSVERVVVGRVVETAPGIREDGEVTIIPVLEEQLIVTKRLVLKEEIHVRRYKTATPWVDTITLRRETATVEPIEKRDA